MEKIDKIKVKKRNFIHKPENGFTMVELIVVLVIIAILAAVSIPALMGYIDSSREKKVVNKAEVARKATQAALTSLYNDGGHRFTNVMREQVETEVGKDDVSTTGTAFMVWTFKALGDSAIPATIENVGAYTINRAYYKVSDTVYVFYKNGAWEYSDFDSKDAADTAVDAFKTESAGLVACDGIAMGDYTADSLGMVIWGENGIGNDYANRTDDVPQDIYGWDINGTNEIEKKLTLKGSGDFSSDGTTPRGIYFKTLDGTRASEVTLVVKKGMIENYWMNSNGRIHVIDQNNVEWELQIEEKNGIIFRGWNYGTVSGGEYSEATQYLNGQADEDFPTPETISVACERPVDTKWARFYAYNADTLTIPSSNEEGYVEVCFRKYQADWLNAYSDAQGIADGASDMDRLQGVDVPSSLKEKQGNGRPKAEFTGWANKQGNDYLVYNSEGNMMFTDEEDIWDYVWETRGGNKTSPFLFYGVVDINATILLKANEYSTFSSGAKVLECYVTFNEMSGELVSGPDFSKLDGNPLQTEADATFYGWNEEVDGVIDRQILYENKNDLTEYFTNGKGLSKMTYAFVARVLKTGRAKFKSGGEKDLKGLRGQLYYMGNGNKANLKSFERVYNLDAVSGFFGNQLLDSSGTFNTGFQVVVNGTKKDASKTEGNACYYQIESGGIHRFFVLYNGKDTGFSEPIFGYTVPVEGGYRGYWYSKDPNPALEGDFTSCFDGFSNLILNDATGLQSLDTSLCTNMKLMFYKCKFDTNMVNLKDWDTRAVTSMLQMFNGSNLKKLNMRIDARSIVFPHDNNDKPNWNCGLRWMFLDCTSLTEATLEIVGSDEAKWTGKENKGPCGVSATEMFKGCTSLKAVAFSNESFCSFTTRGMFLNCSSLENIDITVDFTKYENNIDSLGNAREMFMGCNALKTAKVHFITNEGCPVCVKSCFLNCNSLESVDLGENTIYLLMGDPADTDSRMFENCSKLTSVSMCVNTAHSHDGSNSKNKIYLSNMFKNCPELVSVELRGDFSGVYSMNSMFYKDANLTTLIIRGMEDDDKVNFDSLTKTDCLKNFINDATLKEELFPSFLESFSYWSFPSTGFTAKNVSENFMNAASRNALVNYIQNNHLTFRDADYNNYTINTNRRLEKLN